MTADEKRLVRDMHFNQLMPRTEIADAVGRSLSSICRLLAQRSTPNPVGRPRALSEKHIDQLVAVLNQMVDNANATYEVSLPMLMRRARVKACSRVVANALHSRGYWFRDLRHKPILLPEDVKARMHFATKHMHKPKAWWVRHVHVHLDNHLFKCATTVRGRTLLAKRVVRGVYRTRGKSLRPGHVKPHPKLKLSLGCKGILKVGGVGGGKVLVWHTICGTWCGEAAASAYTDVIAPALKAHYPGRTSFLVLEDNDPTGNLSKLGCAAKAASHIKAFEIPKRSPDLNVLDYAIWSEVERRLRAQERKWPTSKRESRTAFEKRLDRTARNLSTAFIERSIGDMARRCRLLYEAKGGLFEEGGKAN